jgi:7,8-dihydroneopterin aldolase/epimerase/oxygenase
VILEEFGVEWVRVTLNKPGAIRNSRDVGVVIERSRADLGPGGATAAPPKV